MGGKEGAIPIGKKPIATNHTLKEGGEIKKTNSISSHLTLKGRGVPK